MSAYESVGRKTKLVFVPLKILLIYPVLIAFDLVLTYLATPDLKYEANPIINIFLAKAFVFFIFILPVNGEAIDW